MGFGIGDNDTFTKFKKVDMTKLIQQYNKNTLVIKQYSKLPVKSMRNMLSHHFTLVDNKLVRKNEVTNAVVNKEKKRITPNLVTVETPTQAMNSINNSSMTQGQKRFASKLHVLELKEKNKTVRAAFNKLRG